MRCIVPVPFLATLLLLVGCGGGGGGGSDERTTPTASVESWYQDIEIASRNDHQVLGILVDATTGDFVAPEYRTVGVATPVLSGAVFRVQGYSGTLRLNDQGLPGEIIFETGERLLFSEYTDMTVKLTTVTPDSGDTLSEIVPLDADRLELLRVLLSDLGFSPMSGTAMASQAISPASARSRQEMELQAISLGLNILGCGISVATAAGTGGVATPLALASCGSAALKGWSALSGSRLPAIVSVPLDVVACKIHIDVTACLGLLADTMSVNRSSFVSVQVRVDGSGEGRIASHPSGIGCDSATRNCERRFAEGITLELRAQASAGSSFSGWGGDCAGFSSPCTISTNRSRDVRATFVKDEAAQRFSLTVVRTGTGLGNVKSEPAGIDCGLSCESAFVGSAVVTLTAQPSVGSRFEGWGSACTGTGPCTVIMDRARMVSARFVLDSGSGDSGGGPVPSPGVAFTKLDANGLPLPAAASQWSCVRDNATGLVWEAKTADGGLRDYRHTYLWHDPDPRTNGGDPGVTLGQFCPRQECDTHGYTEAVNGQRLCGASDWRVPTVMELVCIADGARSSPAINTDFFPNTLSRRYWTSSTAGWIFWEVWRVNFADGSAMHGHKGGATGYPELPVRLVRGQPPDLNTPPPLTLTVRCPR